MRGQAIYMPADIYVGESMENYHQRKKLKVGDSLRRKGTDEFVTITGIGVNIHYDGDDAQGYVQAARFSEEFEVVGY